MKNCSIKGVYLLIKECAVFLAKRLDGPYVNGTFWNAIFLDKYGEEDIGFKRGKPLFLDTASYNQLRQLWLDHSIDDAVHRKGARHYNL
jgi:E3 ubiquitin-protein ligase UBR1